MKISFRGLLAVAEAENVEESVMLLRIAKGNAGGGTRRVHKKHRKHNFKKICDYKYTDGSICGKECKGLKGLGVHKATHNRELLSF